MIGVDEGNDKSPDDTNSHSTPWSTFLTEATQRFRSAGFENPETEARWIVETASGYSGASLSYGLEQQATERGVAHFDGMVERRLRHEPLQYVCGAWGFRTLDLMVDHRVLIPRPETEIVAGIALSELERSTKEKKIAVDLGTGSGAIGLAIATEIEDVDVVLTDISSDALQVARANLAGLGVHATNVTIYQGSWFEALPKEYRKSFSLIVSNPPYISLPEMETLPPNVREWEPRLALASGEKGTEYLELIVDEAEEWLEHTGSLVLEMAPHHVDAVSERMLRRGYSDVQIFQDLSGRDRGVVGRWS
ncbi:MAG: protein-(glutamine-N5) methyltransferase, release factor-specific [Acidimicrobiaceae bacterium]|nr:protein-(glutamine-N5) methyltransferase, release factor-specific [Acidimicrobiaceae bacterium]